MLIFIELGDKIYSLAVENSFKAIGIIFGISQTKVQRINFCLATYPVLQSAGAQKEDKRKEDKKLNFHNGIID